MQIPILSGAYSDGNADFRVSYPLNLTPVVQASISVGSALAVGSTAKLAGRFNTNDIQVARDGALGTADTVATLPTAPTFIRFGDIASSGTNAFGYIRRAAIINSTVSDAQLQAMTA